MATFDNGDEELILFQCKRCNSIITDSSNSDGANADLGIIILLEHPVTLKRQPLLEDGQGSEAECTFHTLDCSNCGATVGKLFQAVPDELLELSGHTTLEISRLQFYTVPLKLNSSKVSHASSSQDTREPEMKKPLARGEDEDNSLRSIRSDIQKMQYVMCHFDERIGRIEKILQLPDIEEDAEVSSVSLATTENGSRYETLPVKDTFVISQPPRMQSELLTSSRDNTNLVDRLCVIERDLENRKGIRTVSRSDSESQEHIASRRKVHGTAREAKNSSRKKRAAAEQPSSQERKKPRRNLHGKSK